MRPKMIQVTTLEILVQESTVAVDVAEVIAAV